MQDKIIIAVRSKAKASGDAALTNVEAMIRNPVGIGEHGEHHRGS